MFFVKLFTVSAVLASLVGVGISAPDKGARLLGGQEVDNLRQFPHHVYIIPFQSSHRCGGTILNDQWVLTSASCVKNSIRLDLNFGKKSENNTRADFFSVSVNSDRVFLYPTNYDDIALIKIPLRLVFSETIAPISISKLPSHALNERFSVMPGFNEIITTTTYKTTTYYTTPSYHPPTTISTTSTMPSTTTPGYYPPTTTSTTQWPSTETTEDETDSDPYAHHFEGENYEHFHHAPPHPEVDGLKYGMFNIVNHHICKRALGDARFDEYTQLCVEGWGTNPNAPCCSDFGSGLIVGWPAKSELVGIFSMFSPTCTSKLPSIFTYVPKYLPWIESMIRG